jgi:hypothetical protein
MQSPKILFSSAVICVDTVSLSLDSPVNNYYLLKVIMSGKSIFVLTSSSLTVFNANGALEHSYGFPTDTTWSNADMIGADSIGNTYVYRANTNKLFRFGPGLSFRKQVTVPTLDSCKLTVSNDGIVYLTGHNPLNYNVTHYWVDYIVKVFRYDSTLTLLDSQTVSVPYPSYDIGRLQISGDTVVASDIFTIRGEREPRFVFLYNRQLTLIGQWCLDSIPQWRDNRMISSWTFNASNDWRNTMGCLRGDNGIWALYPKNSSWIRFLSPDLKIIARSLINGALLKIDSQGYIYYVNGNSPNLLLCRYKIK